MSLEFYSNVDKHGHFSLCLILNMWGILRVGCWFKSYFVLQLYGCMEPQHFAAINDLINF